MQHTYLTSPIGTIKIQSNGRAITALSLSDEAPAENMKSPPECPVLQQAVAQLTAYFAGSLKHFDLPLEPIGTEFQKQVWEKLALVPFGSTQSYADIARAINNPKGVRAVGLANSKNPIAIVVPCHRVIGSNGKLTGYAGGLERKEWLLKHEGGFASPG